MEKATFAAGCFWCVEAVFQSLQGVIKAEPGYAGGHTTNPSYEEVCQENTGHAEVVRIEFDPQQISYEVLVDVFFHTHNPTTLNRQGNDVGTRYRSAIFYHDDEQKKVAKNVMSQVESQNLWPDPIVTKIEKLSNFFPAETYHMDYFKNNPQQPYCQLVVAPKLKKFREKYKNLLK